MSCHGRQGRHQPIRPGPRHLVVPRARTRCYPAIDGAQLHNRLATAAKNAFRSNATARNVFGQHRLPACRHAAAPLALDLLRSELQATAALVFARALPGGLKPGLDQSRSYAQCQQAPKVTSAPEGGPAPSRVARRSARHARRRRNGAGQRRHDRCRSHRGCQYGTARAWPKPSTVGELAALGTHRTGESGRPRHN